jgi:ZIP family zinc transporter
MQTTNSCIDKVMAIILTLFTFVSTLLGGITSIKYKDKIHLILGFTAGVLLGLVTFDLMPEIFKIVRETNIDPIYPMIALVTGFMIFHILEKTVLIHHAQEDSYGEHHHPSVGLISAIALTGHSFLDGVGIGLGFQVSPALGIVIAVAVIGHDFCDGLNTGSLMLINKNSDKKSFILIFADAIAPVFGAISTLFFRLPNSFMLIYLGFFAGFLLYIGLEDILPEAHSKGSSLKTIGLTIVGIIFIFIITRFA